MSHANLSPLLHSQRLSGYAMKPLTRPTLKIAKRPLCRLLCAALGLTASAWVCAAPLDDMRKLVETGQFEPAYKAALANPEQIGTPHFDFLYGLAAIGAGHVPEGLLALERHLAAVPANDRARLELARGYFLLGEYGRAKLEFEFVLKHNPPKEVQANISHYLDSMQTRDSAALRATSRLYVDAGFGHDSNVNGGTYNRNIQLLTGVIPIANATSLAVADNYYQVTAGGQWLKRVSPQLAVFAGGDVDLRENTQARSYNLDNYGLYTGFSYLKGSGLYRVSAAESEMVVGRVRYRNLYSLSGEAQYTVAPGRSLSGFMQYAEANYTGANKVLDSRMTTLGVSAAQAFEGVMLSPSVGMRLSMAKENNQRMRYDLSRKIDTAQFFGSVTPLEHVGLSASFTWQKQDFLRADLAFGTVRQDRMKGLDISLSYALNRNWSARCELQASDNRSNQNLYDYKRRATALKTRYEF